MDINYSDPLSGIATCEEKDRGKLLGHCVVILGTHGAINGYIEHGLHVNPDGTFKTIKAMTGEFRGLVRFETFLKTLRTDHPDIFKAIKEAGGHRLG